VEHSTQFGRSRQLRDRTKSLLNYDTQNPEFVVLPKVLRQTPLRRILVEFFLLGVENLREVVEDPGIARLGR
jgi:hypothetical protein